MEILFLWKLFSSSSFLVIFPYFLNNQLKQQPHTTHFQLFSPILKCFIRSFILFYIVEVWSVHVWREREDNSIQIGTDHRHETRLLNRKHQQPETLFLPQLWIKLFNYLFIWDFRGSLMLPSVQSVLLLLSRHVSHVRQWSEWRVRPGTTSTTLCAEALPSPSLCRNLL